MSRTYFGMDYGGTNLKTGIFSADGETVVFKEMALREFTSQGDLLENLQAYVKEFTSGHAPAAGGLAIKGLINTTTGVMENDIGAGELLAGKNLIEAFTDVLGIPFIVENDARAYAWGEWRFGAGRGSRVMACLTLGTGLGCALMADGKPYQGADSLGGILGGHISIDRHGPECPCGQRGCLELYCSATAFNRMVGERHPEIEGEDKLPAFFKALETGTGSYEGTLAEFQQNLAIGIVNVIHAYGPDTIVIGGGVMNSSQQILPGLIAMVHDRAWTIPRRSISIKAAELGNRAAALGAAFHPRLAIARGD